MHHPKAEREEELVLKVEAEGSEDGMEEGFDDQRTGDEEEARTRDGDDGADAANEPQDLSLVDYSQYDGAALPEHHMAAAMGADGTLVSRGVPSRVQATGKLSCDICGLSCVSINVLLVHKRSHTGEYRNTTPRPDLKHARCENTVVSLAGGDNAARTLSTRWEQLAQKYRKPWHLSYLRVFALSTREAEVKKNKVSVLLSGLIKMRFVHI